MYIILYSNKTFSLHEDFVKIIYFCETFLHLYKFLYINIMSLGHPQQIPGLQLNYPNIANNIPLLGLQQPHFYQPKMQNPYDQNNVQFGMQDLLFQNYHNQYFPPNLFAHLQQINTNNQTLLPPPYPSPYDYYPLQRNNIPTGN